MISLEINNQKTELVEGRVVHLKIVAIDKRGQGSWHLIVDDVTPLPGAEPPSYACGICGIVEDARLDGSLPDGWLERVFEQGHIFVCANPFCQEQPVCRICGCTNEAACETEDGPCYWVENDLCSACSKAV